MTDKETIKEIKEILTEYGQGQIFLFINCKIDNMTIVERQSNFKEGEHQHYYQKTPGQIVTQGHKEGV